MEQLNDRRKSSSVSEMATAMAGDAGDKVLEMLNSIDMNSPEAKELLAKAQ